MSKPPAIEPLLTIDDVAGICRVCTKTVRRWIDAKAFPAARLGGQWRIEPRDLRLFLNEARNDGPARR